jgi:hypothetical protein
LTLTSFSKKLFLCSMKTLKYLSVLLTGLFLFVACQKELSLESGFAGKVSTGSLLDSAGNCQNITVSGSYIVDSTLTGNNYVVVKVNLATGGSYKVFTDTQNGFFFQDSGFLAAGEQSIKLKATGKPLLASETVFTVAFDTTFCSFSITVIGNTPATYSLTGNGGPCSGSSVQGAYTTGTALNAANKVALQVNVTALGSYAITTAPVGGMTFSGTGNFTTLGPQTITLQGVGTPTTAGINNIPVTAGSSTCSFPVNVTTGGAGNTVSENDSDTAWQFSAGGKNYNGPFFDVFDTTVNNVKGLIFLGYTPVTGDTTIQFGAFSPTGTFAANSNYSSKGGVAAFYFTDYATDTTGANIYKAIPPSATTPVPVEDLKLTILTFNTTTMVVTGTFSGTALNAVGVAVPITNGRFKGRAR